jgi:hypothetical protein
MRRFEDFKRQALTTNDFVVLDAGRGKKAYIKKSGLMKYALACQLSLEKRDERVEEASGGRIYHYTYRAIAPNGRFADAVGSASTKERNFSHPDHDVRALAQTRACNRAISNLVASGEVSAEEMASDEGGIKDSENGPAASARIPDVAKSASDLTNEKLASLMWVESLKLPQLSTVKVTPALLEHEPVAKLLYEKLKISKDGSWKVGEITYKLSVTVDAEFLQRWQAVKGA